MNRNPVRLLALSVLILAVFSFPQMIPRVHAVPGLVCIAPDLSGVTGCPATPVALTGPVTTSPATQIRVQVFIQMTDPMNGFDVTLLAPHASLVPVGVDLTGSILASPQTILAECLQGVLVKGSVCQSTDTIDTLHLAAVAPAGAPLTTAGASGLLFTAIYRIVGVAPATTTIGYQTGCPATSSAGNCVTISNGTVIPVPETVQTGSFSSSTTQPSIQVSPNGASLGTFFSGTSPAAPTVTITDAAGSYLGSGQADGGGDTSYSVSVAVAGPTGSSTGLTATVSASSFTFASATPGPFTSILTITNSLTATPGTWSVSVTGLYHFDKSCVALTPASCLGPASTLTQSVTYTLTVVDFVVTSPTTVLVPYWCSPSPPSVTGPCPANTGSTQTLTVSPAGYTGIVTVATAAGTPSPPTTPALSVAYSTTSIAGASGSSIASFAGGVLRPATTTGSYIVRTSLTGTIPTGSKTKTVTWVVRPQDFNMTSSNGTPTGPSITFASTSSATDTLTIGSLPSGSAGVNAAAFAGPVSLSSTITGGSGLVVTPTTNPVTLIAGQKLTDLVTFSGTVAATTTFTVTITGTATLVTSTPSTQTHSVTYSVTITSLATTPTVTVNSPTPNPANTGTTVTVTFTVSSTATVTGITVSWGDGTTPDSLAGTATSDTHVYASTGIAKSQIFTITVTATNSAGPGSGTTTETVNDRPPVVAISTVSPNPANTGATITVSFTATDPDGTVSSISVNWGDASTPTSLAGTATSATHTYANTGIAKTQAFTITVTATDNSGSTGFATASETVNDRPPVVSLTNISPNPVNTGILVTVTFTATDPDGTVSSIMVNWGDSSPLDTLAGTATSDTHTYTSAGSFTITVTATDNSGSTGQATGPITVNAIGVPTVTVHAPTPNPANTGQTVTVTFTVSSGVTVTRITVNWGDGTTPDSLAGTATSDTHLYSSTGAAKSQTFTITVTATNSAGPGSGTTTETVNDRPPTVTVSNVSPNAANTGATVTVTFSAADPDGTIASFTVNWGDTTTPDNLPGSSTSDTHVYTSAGSFTITVTATDNSGSAGQATSPVTVQTPVGVPAVTVNSPTPKPANTGATVTVTFTVSSTATVTGITVNWGDGTTPDSLAGTAASDTHVYTSTGNVMSKTFTITVTATNSAGSGSGTTTETVNDRPPVASFTFTPASPSAGQTVSFDATASADPDGTIVSYSWSFGDGTTGTGVTPTHAYNPATTTSFTVMLTLTDNSGSTGSTSHSITVTVTAVSPPVVTITNVSPNPANTGLTVTVTFTVSSTVAVTGITVSWGDGTTPDSLSGTARTDTHSYASTGNAMSKTFTITVTATNSAGPGSATTTETVNDRPPVVTISSVSPNPANTGQTVSLSFTAADPDGTVSKIVVNWGDSSTPDTLAGTATSGTHTYTTTGSFTITVTATDNSGSTGSATASETVTTVTTTPIKLTFQGNNLDDFDNGVGQLQVFVNGHLVVDIPAGLNHLSGTGDFTPNMDEWVSFGPFDITSFVVQGQNTIVFMSPPPGHFGLIRNVTITQGNVILLHVRGVRFVSLDHPVTFTFSIPPLVITSFTVSNSTPSVDQNVTFTATFTGGTAPFTCIFRFGDDESASTVGTGGSCSVTHDYDSSGTFTARVIVIGASTSDRVSSSLNVTVMEVNIDPPSPQLALVSQESSLEDD